MPPRGGEGIDSANGPVKFCRFLKPMSIFAIVDFDYRYTGVNIGNVTTQLTEILAAFLAAHAHKMRRVYFRSKPRRARKRRESLYMLELR